MEKKIVNHEIVGDQSWAGEYYEWECGCIEVKFYDGAPSFKRKLCGNDHEKAGEITTKCKQILPRQ